MDSITILDMIESNLIKEAAAAIANAQALLIAAGAGMGVDSGLPDFRGNEGFWNAYPPYRGLGLSFPELANPRWFETDPGLAWGFYGHRLNLYRATLPHNGFAILKGWMDRMEAGASVFTSNVDGHFQRSGFPPACITEVHGSIHHLQCMAHCGTGIFPADGACVEIDESSFRASNFPRCPQCGALARPNVLMFDDWDWEATRSEAQHQRQKQWLAQLDGRPLLVIELGAGTAVRTVRGFSESMLAFHGARLIRINVREPQVGHGQLGIPLGAKAALEAIEEELNSREGP